MLKFDRKNFTRSFNAKSLIYVEDQGLQNTNDEYLEELNQFIANKRVISIEPSGLSLCHGPIINIRSTDFFKIPYSDHSSYNEIIEFVKQLNPKRVIPIVRKLLPNNVDTTDMKELSPFLSKKMPITGAIDKYKLLLKSCTTNMTSANLNGYSLNRNEDKSSNRRKTTPISLDIRSGRVATKVKIDAIKGVDYYDSPEKKKKKLADEEAIILNGIDNIDITEKLVNNSQSK